MSIKVHKGTVRSSGESLCLSCQSSTVAVTDNSRTFIHCSEYRSTIQHKIVQCSSYHKKGTPDEWEFQKLAWTLQTDKVRGPIGFQPPNKERHETF